MRGYRLARDVYHRVRKPELIAERRRARDFYRGLVSPGELAFDVGAFRGEVSEALSSCGARVVAVEPNPELASRLRRLRFAFAVEQVALGAKAGEADLRLGRYAGHSTLSEDWVSAVGADRFSDAIRVNVKTLDELVAHYGEPAYIKIDVEGYEPEVVAGLSRPVRTLSFEFQCAALSLAWETVDRLSALGGYDFNLTLLEERNFTHDWCDRTTIVERVTGVCADSGSVYGDLFARLRQQRAATARASRRARTSGSAR